MRRALLAVLVVAVAGGAWFVLGPGTRGGPSPDEGGGGAPGADGRSPEELKAASLSGASGRGAARARRGACAIVGTVRRGGAPAAAEVEVVHLGEASFTNPFSRRRGGFFDRVLETPAAKPEAVGRATAGADGKFAVEGLGPGFYRVVATASDGAQGWALASLPIDGVRAQADPALAPAGESLSGRAVRTDGTAWKGTIVVNPGSRMDDPTSMILTGVTVATDDAGRFRATGLPRGDVTLNAIEPGVFRVVVGPVALPYAQGEYVFTVDAGLSPVEGRVVSDADSSPVAGADVMAGGKTSVIQMQVTKAVTDADGRFRVVSAAGEGGGLVVTATGYAPKFLMGQAVKSPMEVRLGRGARMVGRVATEDGSPVAGVSVSAINASILRQFNPFSSEPGTSGADGRYEIADLAPGDVMALAQGAGWVTKGLKDVTQGGYNPYAVRLEPGKTSTADVVVVRGARAAGSVFDADGKGVPGALVRAESQAGLVAPSLPAMFMREAGAAATGADGAFEVDGLVAGTPYVLAVTAPDHPSARSEPFTPEDGAPARVDVRFPATRWLAVTVLDDGASTPVSGAQVSVSVPSGGNSWRGDGPAAVTGADGTLRAGPLPPGALQVSASHPDYLRGQSVPVPAGQDAVTLRVKRGRPLSGRVVKADKSPAPNVTVWVESEGRGGSVSPERTDAEGRFRFRAAPTGAVNVLVRGSGDGEGVAKAGPSDDDVTIVLGSGGASPEGRDTVSVVVRVVDPDGKPVPEAQVSIESPRGGTNGSSARDGRATVNLGRAGADEGDRTVQVWGARDASGSPLPLGPASVPLRAGQRDIEVRLPTERFVSGVVKGPDGAKIKGALVLAARPGREGDLRWNDQGALGSARTDAEGTFRVGGIGDGAATLVVRAPREFAPLDPVPVRGGQSGVEIVLRMGATVTVNVVDPDAAPVAGARVRIQPVGRGEERASGPPEFTVTTDGRGRAEFRGLDGTRRHTLWVTSPPVPPVPGQSPDPSSSAFLPFQKADWTPADETVRLERAYTVSGIVRDLAGRPAEGVQVWRKTGEGGWHGGSASDANGVFLVTDLPAGEVSLRFSVSRSMRGDALQPGDRRVVDLTVRAGAKDAGVTVDLGLEITLKIENWSAEAGRRSSWAELYEGGAGGRQREPTQVGADGVARWRGLEAGSVYALWVRPNTAGLSLYRKDVRAGSEVRASLEPGRTLSGRVTAPAGATQMGVYARSGSLNLQGTVDGDGRYEIKGVPDGLTWTVRASARSGDKGLASPEKEVASGGTADLEVADR